MKPFTYKEYLKYQKKTLNLSDIKEEYIYNPKEENKINNPHDKIFKEILDIKEEVVRFINKNLNIENTKYELQEEDLEKYNRNFITNQFENMESDIIYKKKDEDIFFLIEHQSKIDYSMPYRILKYNISIMESAIDKKKIKTKEYKIPAIYTFVLYTGQRKWNVEKYIIDKQLKLEGCTKDIFGSYKIVDINNYTKEELIKEKGILSKILVLEKAKTVEELEKSINEIVERRLDVQEKEFLQRVMKYIIRSKISQRQYKEIMEKIKIEKEEEIMFVKLISDLIDEMLEKEEVVKRKEDKIAKKEDNIAKREDNIAKKEDKIAKKEDKIAKKEDKIAKKENKIAKKENIIAIREDKLNKREYELYAKEKELDKQKDNIIIEMVKNNIDENTIIKITKINKTELAKIKDENNLCHC